MKYKIRDNWIATFSFIRKNNIILIPFMFIAFFEALSLELLYFSARTPLSYLSAPLIRKFFGGQFTRYPDSVLIVPKLFYYAQVVIYIFLGVFLMGMAVNIFKNLKSGLPVKLNALVKNALSRYFSFLFFGIIYIVLLTLLKNASAFAFLKAIGIIAKHASGAAKFYFVGLSGFLFLLNVIVQVFLVCAIPLIVLTKKRLFPALLKSVIIGFKNFFTIFALIFLPFLVYLPVTLLKSGSLEIAVKMFPEVNLFIIIAGIVIAMFVDCFIYICAAQFLMDKEK